MHDSEVDYEVDDWFLTVDGRACHIVRVSEATLHGCFSWRFFVVGGALTEVEWQQDDAAADELVTTRRLTIDEARMLYPSVVQAAEAYAREKGMI